MGVKEIECKADWDKFVRDAGRKAIICDFVATWCGPCKMMGPKFVRMEKEFPNVFFCKVDVDEYEDFAQDCEVSVMPTFQVFIEGKKAAFRRELEDAGDRLVAVDFTATWCPHSKRTSVTQSIQKLMAMPEFSEVIFLQVDVDDNEETAAACHIDFLPTLQLYRYSNKVAEIYEDGMDNLQAMLQLHG